MFKERKSVRYQTMARVKMPGMSESETLLKDISVTGCCMECSARVDILPDVQYTIEIVPESAARISGFNLVVMSRWMKAGSASCEVGFSIVKSPTGRTFQRYVDYLSWRYEQGNSMTGDSAPPDF